MTRRFACLHFVREVRLELGGVVAVAVDLCQSMAARGHRVALATCDARDVPARWNEPQGDWPEVIEVPRSASAGMLLSRRALDRFRSMLPQYDVAHLHTPWELSNFQLLRPLRAAGVPYVVSVHGMLDAYSMRQKPLKKHAFLSLGGRALFRNATTIHFTAQAEMDQALQFIPGRDRAAVQGFALDPAAYEPPPGPEMALRSFPQIRSDARRILFLSRIHPKKGLDRLIRAAALLKRSSLPFQLLIAGPGEDSYITAMKSLAEQLGVADATAFLGMVQGVEKRSLYEAADVFVLPTHQENFGLVLAEAMACGTAVVTTRGADIWQELEEGGARIVDGSPEQIADAILDVVADPEKCRRIGQQGRDYVYQWLDRERVSAAYEAMYLQTIDRGLPPFNEPLPKPGGAAVVAR